MTRRKRFCADCGPTDSELYENFCQTCFWKINSIVDQKETSVDIPYCLTCYSVKLSSGWFKPTDESTMKDHLAANLTKLIKFNFISRVQVEEMTDINWNIPKPEFEITYEVFSDEIEEFDEHREVLLVNVLLNGGICTSCVKKKTGSTEVTVQFRAKQRKITSEEEKYVAKLAFEVVNKHANEITDSYLSDIIDNHGGIDLFFGSQFVAEELIQRLKNKWIGHTEVNFQLQTEDKEGKRIYRRTYLYRIPQVQSGEFVTYNNSLNLVIDVSKDGVKLLDLRNFEKKNVRDWDNIFLTDPNPRLVKKIIVSEDYNLQMYQIMDENSYEIIEIPKSHFPYPLTVGNSLNLLEWDDEYYTPPETIDGE